MTSEEIRPNSGFRSWEFWGSFLTMALTVALNLLGVFPGVPRFWGVPGAETLLPILAVAGICIYLVAYTYRAVRQSHIAATLPAANLIAIGSRRLFDTTEFWLGAIAILLQLFQQNDVLIGGVNNAVTISFLVLAIVYILTRSQLKIAYLRGLLFKVTKEADGRANIRITKGLIPFDANDLT